MNSVHSLLAHGLVIALLSSALLQSSAFRLSGAHSALVNTQLPGRLNERQSGGFESEPNGTQFVWTIKDVYEGQNFFDQWTFFNYTDPTDGLVNFVNQTTAFASVLAYVNANNEIIMKGDNTTWLAEGAVRDSIRIQSVTSYNTSLIILDLNSAPWGCGVWPAFWTSGPDWPQYGEIDIMEGVHNDQHNQITWHTAPGCTLTPSSNYSGTLAGNLNCDATVDDNAGCAIIDWSSASYGPYFDAQKGGVYAMKWDEEGISVWNFYRAAIPVDIINGDSPDPSSWGIPAAQLSPDGCDPMKFFMNQTIIFDITFCGYWAGNSYANTTCPGTCAERIMDPSNFVNASWSINSVKVYSKEVVTGHLTNSAGQSFTFLNLWPPHFIALIFTAMLMAFTY